MSSSQVIKKTIIFSNEVSNILMRNRAIIISKILIRKYKNKKS